MVTKLLPANEAIFLYEKEAFEDPNDPKVVELNNTILGHNISCALTRSYTLDQASSLTLEASTVCDSAERQALADYAVDVMLPGYRSKSLTDIGKFNEFFNLVKVKGIEYYAVKRIGKPQNALWEVGDVVNIIADVTTDNPNEPLEDGEFVIIEARFKTNGFAKFRFKVSG